MKEKYPCTICDYQATSKCNLSQHARNVHQKSENVICTYCNKSIQKRYIKNHIKMLHSGEQPKYTCTICDHQATSKGNLSQHVGNVHQKSENVICTKCNKSIQKRSMTKHIKMIHLGAELDYKR